MISCDDALLAIGEAYGDSLPGRTVIQKVGYFISIVTESDLGYAPHYYGPYSSLMAATLSERVENGDFLENVLERPSSFVGHDKFKRYYQYNLTENGKSAIEIHRSWHIEEFEKAVEVAKAIKNLEVDYMQLSFAAKVHCIAKQQRADLSEDSIREAAENMGWEMTEEDIKQGKRILQKLNLLPETN